MSYNPEYHNPDDVSFIELQRDNEGNLMRFITVDEHRQLLMTGCWTGMLEVYNKNAVTFPWMRNNPAGLCGLVRTMRTSNPTPRTIDEAIAMGKGYAT